MVRIKVKHSGFGVGTVTAQDDKYLTIEFANKTSRFIYPDVFEKFIRAEDPAVQDEIIRNINDAKVRAEQKRKADEAARKAAEEHKATEEAARRAEISRKTSYSPKAAARTQRIDGKRMTFFVFQGNTFEKEYQGGYIWAPISNKAGSTPHHWTRLLDVRKGDIILHGCDGYVQAISVARDACYECAQPAELTVEDLWECDGRRVDCDYVRINKPIKTSNFIDDILRLSRVKYSPFDKDGNGNMGYLFEINRELARIFVEASVKQNPYLGDIEYIGDFLSEEDNA